MNRFMTVALLSAGALLTGCGLESASPQTLVVDPVPVAKSLGRDEQIKQRLDTAVEQLNAQLKKHSAELSAQVEQEQGKLGKNPSAESTAKFQELVAAASQDIKQTQQLARQKAADYRGALLSEFNQELREAAADIAKARGATQVLIADDGVLWFDARADITADVIAKLRARPAATESPSADTPAAGNSELEKLESLVDKIEQQEQLAPPAP